MRVFSAVTFGVVACVAGLSSGASRAADFAIDKAHTNIMFSVMHLGYSRMIGQFNDFKGDLTFDPKNAAKSRVNVVINAASVDTDHEARDNHLRSPDFFNVKEFSEIRFVSTGIRTTGDKTGKISGNFTLLGVTKAVNLDVTFNGMRKHPLPKYKGVLTTGFSARAKIKRSDFGMKYALGGIGDEVDITLEVEAAEKQ